jgi:hypothetical protein
VLLPCPDPAPNAAAPPHATTTTTRVPPQPQSCRRHRHTTWHQHGTAQHGSNTVRHNTVEQSPGTYAASRRARSPHLHHATTRHHVHVHG